MARSSADSSDGAAIVTLSPGAVGEGKALAGCPLRRTGARTLQDGARSGSRRPKETGWPSRSRRPQGGPDLTSNDLRNAILALAAAESAVTNDSGLMHVSAAIGTPTVAIFGPTSPWHWKPLNPIAAILEP